MTHARALHTRTSTCSLSHTHSCESQATNANSQCSVAFTLPPSNRVCFWGWNGHWPSFDMKTEVACVFVCVRAYVCGWSEWKLEIKIVNYEQRADEKKCMERVNNKKNKSNKRKAHGVIFLCPAHKALYNTNCQTNPNNETNPWEN